MTLDCAYTSSANSSPYEQVPTGPTTVSRNLAVDVAQSSVLEFLGLDCGILPPGKPDDSIRALNHFQNTTCHTFGGDIVSRVMHAVVGANVWQYPYLMHMVLAVSAGHQKRLLESNSQRKRLHDLGLAEATHWHHGLKMFQEELAQSRPPPGPERFDFDAMVAAMFLTIVFTFSMDDQHDIDALSMDNDSFVDSIINTMASTGGFCALQAIREAPSHGSIWVPVFSAADDDAGSFTNDQDGIDGLPTAFVQLCDLHQTSSSQTNSYHAILRHLTPLLLLKPGQQNMNKLFAFGGRLHGKFRPLLVRKDLRALLLLSWWLALLRQVDEWWVRNWARTTCSSIVTYLSTASNPKVQALLVFPATFGTADISWIWHLDGD